MTMKLATVCLTFLPIILSGCNSTDSTEGKANINSSALSAETLSLGITAVPPELTSQFSSKLNFNRYTKVTAPNGKAIHIVVQNKLTDNQVIRARSVLEHYLTDYPGSKYGSDKSAVANKMADNNATLLLLNGSDDGTNPAAELNGQPLYQNEIQVEGGNWYVSQNFDHRDATFEEILHMVHDTGIGVDQTPRFIGVLPNYQADIRSAQVSALTNKRWAFSSSESGWVTELTAENSLSQEYLASVIDSYYGLWGSWKGSSEYGMWGLYVAKTRNEISAEDPLGAVLMGDFFQPTLTYNARIDKSFKGDFSLKLNVDKPYSHHSQYLKDVTLTGSSASNVIVNQLDNFITGNQAENRVIFTGNSSEYRINVKANGITEIVDLVDSRDGRNTVKHIETLVFSDTTISL